jgi:3-isopropylmalate/(R)-2-methylmalate dehydratase large subunit
MGKTLAEKILSSHSGRDVTAGEITIAKVDLCLLQDGTGPLTIRQVEKLGVTKLANPKRTVFFLDHASPASRKELANDHMFIRQYAEKMGAQLVDVGRGICHVVINEKYVNPGEVLIGADSHTCTGGALACFATGMGSTDVGIGMAYGKTWFRVPETFKIFVTGEFPLGVFPKDLILHLIGLIGADGATYKSLEFCGPTIDKMDMSGRFTLSNMAVEAGAKVGLIASDETTRAYLEKMGRGDKFIPLKGDDNAEFERVINIDVSRLQPTVSFPHTVDNTRTINEAIGTRIDQVFLGTCTNSRIEDWEVVSKMVKGKQKAANIRFIAVPGSESVLKEAIARGYYQTLIEFGAIMVTPGCGPCVGIHEGVPADGEAVLSTQNRNFQGRMGNPDSSIYLASPATVAATAIEGKLADPRKYIKELQSIGHPEVIDTEALKALAKSAQKTVERVAMDTAAVLGPAAREASDKVEGMAKKAIADYGPKAHQVVKEFESKFSKLTSDVSKAVKDALKTKPAQAAKKKASRKRVTASTKKSASIKARKATKAKRGTKR